MSDPEIKSLLANARTIVVVGASAKPWRDSNRITHFLIDAGYQVYPVNPAYNAIDDIVCYPNVQSIPATVDIVDIFRNPEFVVPVVEDAIAANAKSIWMQLEVVNEEAKKIAEQAGLIVIMDLCILIEHRRLIQWAK